VADRALAPAIESVDRIGASALTADSLLSDTAGAEAAQPELCCTAALRPSCAARISAMNPSRSPARRRTNWAGAADPELYFKPQRISSINTGSKSDRAQGTRRLGRKVIVAAAIREASKLDTVNDALWRRLRSEIVTHYQ
jgi:hypothetical protein